MTQSEHPAVAEGASIADTPAATPPMGSANLAETPPNTESLVSMSPLAPTLETQAVDRPDNHIASHGDDPNKTAAIVLADRTRVVTIDGQEAAATQPDESVGDFSGMAFSTPEGEIAGGNIKKTLDPPTPIVPAGQSMTKERAALQTPVAQKLGGLVGRPITEWGLIGEGDVIHGIALLLDLHTGEKVRSMDGHKVGPGKLYANLRNFPEALSGGDTIEKILGA